MRAYKIEIYVHFGVIIWIIRGMMHMRIEVFLKVIFTLAFETAQILTVATAQSCNILLRSTPTHWLTYDNNSHNYTKEIVFTRSPEYLK